MIIANQINRSLSSQKKPLIRKMKNTSAVLSTSEEKIDRSDIAILMIDGWPDLRCKIFFRSVLEC